MTDDSPFPSAARAVLVLSAVAVLAACGRGEKQASPAAPAPVEPPPAAVAVDSAPPAPAGQTFADAVEAAKTTATSGKAAAAVDLQYDVLAKPAPGQPFEVELAFVPRLPADALDVEVTSIPGITIVNGGTAKFEDVVPATRYTTRVMVSAESSGLYYLGVVARMITQVQTEARAFSVPVVVGTAPPAAKPRPAVDATGQPIISMPAEETAEKPEATKRPE